jgi:hypothetical protein
MACETLYYILATVVRTHCIAQEDLEHTILVPLDPARITGVLPYQNLQWSFLIFYVFIFCCQFDFHLRTYALDITCLVHSSNKS